MIFNEFQITLELVPYVAERCHSLGQLFERSLVLELLMRVIYPCNQLIVCFLALPEAGDESGEGADDIQYMDLCIYILCTYTIDICIYLQYNNIYIYINAVK